MKILMRLKHLSFLKYLCNIDLQAINLNLNNLKIIAKININNKTITNKLRTRYLIGR